MKFSYRPANPAARHWRFEWDDEKAEINLEAHGLNLADGRFVFLSSTFTAIDDRFEYDEVRYFTMGKLKTQFVVLVHTERGNSVRLISLRKATDNEIRLYKKARR